MIKLNYPQPREFLISITALGIVCIAAWLFKLPTIEPKVALTGWSAIDWVAHMSQPENFVRDFSNGVELYDKSSFMHVYPLAQQWLGIPPSLMIQGVILFEIVFLASCGFYLFRTMMPKASVVSACVFSVLLISSYARDMDLSNFGAPFFWGLYYNAADGLRLLAIAFIIRRKILTAAVLFAISFTIHPIIALIGCVFALVLLAFQKPIEKPQRLVVGLLAFSMIVIAWLLLKFTNADVSSGAIDPQIWIDMARIFNQHFFPIEYGTFTTAHHVRILPFVSLLALAVFYLPKVLESSNLRIAVLVGMFVLCILVFVGLLITQYSTQPALIKLTLTRSSALIITIALAVAVSGLVNDIFNGSPFRKALALALLLSTFFVKPGFPALPALIIILHGLVIDRLQNRISCIPRLSIFMVFLIIVMYASYYSFGFVNSKSIIGYLGSYQFWLYFIIFFAVSIGVDKFRFRQPAYFYAMIILGASFFSAVLWQYNQMPKAEYTKLGNDYLETQRWAKLNTATDSLFMVDPTIYYGWRDYSSRSSFGNFREWTHTSWLYDSRIDRFTEGMNRFNELGIDLKPYLAMKPTYGLAVFKKLHVEVLERFYNFEPEWFNVISKKYDINYLVMSKKSIHQVYPFKLEFENDSFVVYKLN